MALRSVIRSMRPRAWRTALALCGGAALTVAAATVAHAWADFEVKAPDGRTLLIKDNGTWTVVPAAEAASAAAPAASAPPPYEGPFAELRIDKRQPSATACTYTLTLANKFAYEIRSFVPEFVVERRDGVAYTTQSLSFHFIRPGDERRADLQLLGVRCEDIGRLLVQRGDRCEMGELHRFLDPTGQCLQRVKLMPTDLVKFEKAPPPAVAASGGPTSSVLPASPAASFPGR